MSVPSSLLEASCLRDLEHNGSEEMIIMIMIMMTRKKWGQGYHFQMNRKQLPSTSWKAPFRSGKLQNCFFFLWFSSPLQIVFTLIDTTCLQQAGWNVYIDEKLRKYLSSISVSFSTFTFLMTGDNYQANVVDKTDHMWQTIFILISGGWGGHHGWKLRVSFSLSLSRWPEIMTKDNGYSIFFHG